MSFLHTRRFFQTTQNCCVTFCVCKKIIKHFVEGLHQKIETTKTFLCTNGFLWPTLSLQVWKTKIELWRHKSNLQLQKYFTCVKYFMACQNVMLNFDMCVDNMCCNILNISTCVEMFKTVGISFVDRSKMRRTSFFMLYFFFHQSAKCKKWQKWKTAKNDDFANVSKNAHLCTFRFWPFFHFLTSFILSKKKVVNFFECLDKNGQKCQKIRSKNYPP